MDLRRRLEDQTKYELSDDKISRKLIIAAEPIGDEVTY